MDEQVEILLGRKPIVHGEAKFKIDDLDTQDDALLRHLAEHGDGWAAPLSRAVLELRSKRPVNDTYAQYKELLEGFRTAVRIALQSESAVATMREYLKSVQQDEQGYFMMIGGQRWTVEP